MRRSAERGGRSTQTQVISRLLGAADHYYAQHALTHAAAVLNAVIRLAPRMWEPYHKLGVILYDIGDKERAATFNMIAGHLMAMPVAIASKKKMKKKNIDLT